MSTNTLTARKRTDTGKGPARRLRASGDLPGIYYIRGSEGIPLSVNISDLQKLIRHKPPLISLEIEGESARECVIRELQRDPVDDSYVHIDLMGITRGQKLTVTVPVELVGTAVGVKTGGGILQHLLSELEIECLPKDIPAEITVDVSQLEIGHAIYIHDLQFPALKFLDDPKTPIASVVHPTVVREVTEAAPTAVAVAEGAKEEPSGED